MPTHPIALHQNTIKPLGLGNVSNFLSRLRLLKQIIGIALGSIHRKHKLAVLVRSSTRLFEFEAVVGSGMGALRASSEIETRAQSHIPSECGTATA